MKENRRYPRIKIDRRAGLILPGGGIVLARACDVSVDGMALLHDYQLAEGDHCRAFILLPHYSKAEDMEVRAVCRVAYCILSNSHLKFRIGMQFVELEQGGTVLEQFVSLRANYSAPEEETP